MSRKTVLLVSNADLTFIEDDYSILCSHYNVEWLIIRTKLDYLKLFKIFKFDIAYCWLAHYHSFILSIFTVIFQRKLIIHIGGHEVSTIKFLNFGAQANRFRYYAIKFSLKISHKVIAAGEHLKKQLLVDYPFLQNKIVVINHGFNPVFWSEPDYLRKKNTVLTVIADSKSYKRLAIKGIPEFVKTAASLPNVEFIIVGNSAEFLSGFFNLSKNLKIIPPLNRTDLKEVYFNSKIYCQLSLSEGFGMALCESMLCGCKPIVSNVGMMPAIIEDSGFVVDPTNTTILKKTIIRAMEEPPNNARQVILKKFNMQFREDKLVLLIDTLVG